MTSLLLAVALMLALVGASAESALAKDKDRRDFMGISTDANAPQLGKILYLCTKGGYHFWFRPNANLAFYEAGHRYHNVYRFEVDDPSKWASAVVPDREPYNICAAPGTRVYYKSFDLTTDTRVRP